MTPEQKTAFEDARELQIAMEYERRARNEAAGVLSLQAEAAQAWHDFKHYRAGTFVRWALKGLGLMNEDQYDITPAMIERGAEEVRGVLRQLQRGTLKLDEIGPGSLAEDVLRAALDA